MDETEFNFKRSEKEEDEAIAHTLAAALCEDDVENFLQIYDQIPASISLERLGNIKEMARQLAALTRNSTYRHSTIPVKDSSFFGLNHTLQATPLTLNGHFNTTDYSVYKTPPEGHTPVDQKHFDYDEETLKTLQVPHNLSLPLCELNDSGIPPQESLDHDPSCNGEAWTESCSMNDEGEANKANDDEFHTPPETPDLKDEDSIEGPPFGFPPSEGELINSAVNNLLSKKLTRDSAEREETQEDCVHERKKIQIKNESGNEQVGELFFEATEVEPKDVKNTKGGSENNSFKSETTTIAVDSERDRSEKDSLDGSPHSRNSFAQEEDDSGISIVDENDIVQESTITSGGHFEETKEFKFQAEKKTDEENFRRANSDSNTTQRTSIIPEKKTCESELKYSKLNCYEVEEASVGWQTRHKRMSKKRHDREFDKDLLNSDINTTESNGTYKEQTGRRSTKDWKNKNGKMDRSESYNKVAERNTDERHKERNNRKSEDFDIHESPKRSGRRSGQAAGKKSDNKWTKNSNREKYADKMLGKRDSPVQNLKSHVGVQPSVFSYRDALLKAGSKVPSTKDQTQTNTPAKEDKTFNLVSAVSYLSSVWTSVNNLHKKDPSKVYIYNGD